MAVPSAGLVRGGLTVMAAAAQAPPESWIIWVKSQFDEFLPGLWVVVGHDRCPDPAEYADRVAFEDLTSELAVPGGFVHFRVFPVGFLRLAQVFGAAGLVTVERGGAAGFAAYPPAHGSGRAGFTLEVRFGAFGLLLPAFLDGGHVGAVLTVGGHVGVDPAGRVVDGDFGAGEVVQADDAPRFRRFVLVFQRLAADGAGYFDGDSH